MEAGNWKMEVGNWKMETGRCKMKALGCSLGDFFSSWETLWHQMGSITDFFGFWMPFGLHFGRLQDHFWSSFGDLFGAFGLTVGTLECYLEEVRKKVDF